MEMTDVKAAPCKGCDHRYPACHDRCPDYISWKKELDASKQDNRDRIAFYEAKKTAIDYVKYRQRNGWGRSYK
jgi:hypothetical protein